MWAVTGTEMRAYIILWSQENVQQLRYILEMQTKYVCNSAVCSGCATVKVQNKVGM